ncbi:MAG: choice-of-anchor tandem repeat GloVer-containing protein [Terriglobales bacterium]
MLQSKSSLMPRITAILFALMFLLLTPAFPQTYQVIYNFTGQGSDGATPYGGPILDRAGNLYGTTYLGGEWGSGSVYRLAPDGSSWKYTSLYSLKGGMDGAGPAFGSLANFANRALLGTTEGGGTFGTVFAVCACPKKEAVLHNFGTGADGAQPIGGVVLDAAGNFYGTTSLGGDSGNGTVYGAKRSGDHWTEKVLYSFGSGNDAVNPVAGVTLDAHGNLYGTTPSGGDFGVGTIYKLTRSGSTFTESILYSFQGLDDGQNPVGGVIFDKAGNLYGATFDGGINGGGTVYQLSPSGAFSVLYSFTGGYGGPYNKLTLAANGSIYSITNGEGANGLGSVFKLAPGKSGWTFTDLYDFVGGAAGALPYGAVAVDASGNVFGTAVVGGTNNQGVVFEITP